MKVSYHSPSYKWILWSCLLNKIRWSVANSHKPSLSLAQWKEIKDSLGFWIPLSGFRIPGTGLRSLSVELGFWIPIVSGIQDSWTRNPDSTGKTSGFQEQKFSGFGILDSFAWDDKFRHYNVSLAKFRRSCAFTLAVNSQSKVSTVYSSNTFDQIKSIEHRNPIFFKIH